MPNFNQYEMFIKDWHYFLKEQQKPLIQNGPEWAKKVNLLILNEFILKPYLIAEDISVLKQDKNYESFYLQFYERLEEIKITIKAL